MSQLYPLRGKLGQCSGQVRRARKIQVEKGLCFWILLQAFASPSGLLSDRHHRCSSSGLKRGLLVQTHYFPFPCREWCRHIVCKGGPLRIKISRLSIGDEWYHSSQTIHLDLIIIYLTLSLRITWTSVEDHWDELGPLTHRRHGPTSPEQPSPFWKHVIVLLWFGI